MSGELARVLAEACAYLRANYSGSDYPQIAQMTDGEAALLAALRELIHAEAGS